MDELLSVEGLRIAFRLPEGEVEAVRGASFTVPVGGTVALVGESGAGKSTVAQAVMGILPANARISGGHMRFRDPLKPGTTVDLAALDPHGIAMRRIRGGRISMIFQEPMSSLSPVHTIGNQIAEAFELHAAGGHGEAEAITLEVLRMVGFSDPKRALRSYPFELSGGLRQRAMIAMALVCQPALLVADEPTTALDVTIQAQILKLIRDLQHEISMAVLIITHDLGIVANLAEQVVVMYRGEVMESGGRDDIFRDPRHPYLKALLNAVPRFGLGPEERLQPIREIARGDSRLFAAAPPPATADAPPLLQVEGLRKRYRLRRGGGLWSGPAATVDAVSDIDLTVQPGECLGLVGESGSGKTTLSKMIMRAVSPDAGRILYNDPETGPVDVLALAPRDLAAFRRRIQFIFQDPFASLNPRMTVLNILTEPLEIHGIGTPQSRVETARELMRLVGLDARFLNRYPHSFSGGQRQRVGIARALALRPKMLICDEPVSALDVSVQAQILNLLKDLKAELGLTYLFISHNLAVVDYVADRIAVMCRGRLVELAPTAALFRRPMHPYTQQLLAAVPHPDPDRPLDFARIGDERGADPASWPIPFAERPDRAMRLHDLGGGHFVRADDGFTPAAMVA
ncbi:MAG: dipeptide ABC transporter ATP-binding protein [Alphaproteobacteria bacterium]